MFSEKKIALLAACAITLGGLALAAPAVAKQKPVIVTAPSDAPTRIVSYRDLNLATQSGEKTLLRRVRHAVGEVCQESLGPSPLDFAGNECRDFAWGGARPQIARAVQRAREIAQFGHSAIAPVAISLSFPGN